MNVGDIMSIHVHTVGAEEKLCVLNDVLAAVPYHHLLVEIEDKLVGVISDRDVMRHWSPFLGTEAETDRDRSLLNKSAADIMTANPVVVKASTPLVLASQMMLDRGVSCLPVVGDDNSIEGILSWRDIVRVYH